MSIKLLKFPQRHHEIHDDLESGLWVLIFIALHRFKQNGPPNSNLEFFSEISFPRWNDKVQFAVGGDKKLCVLLDVQLTLIEFRSPAVGGLLEELMLFFREYSTHHQAPGTRPPSGPFQIALDTQRKLIGDPKNTIDVFNRWLTRPNSQWEVDDWEAIDKYPRQPNWQTTTQDAMSEINSSAVRSSENGQGVCSCAQGSAERLSDQAEHSGSHSRRYGYANMLDLSSSRSRFRGSASSHLLCLPLHLFPGAPLPHTPITPSSQQPSPADNIPKSTKRPLEIDEGHEAGNKKAKTDVMSRVDNSSLDAIIRNEDLDEKLPSWRHKPLGVTHAQSNSSNLSGSRELAHSSYGDTLNPDEARHSAPSHQSQLCATPHNPSPTVSMGSPSAEVAITDSHPGGAIGSTADCDGLAR